MQMMTHPYIGIPVPVRACASTRTDPNTRTGMSITGNGNLRILVPTYIQQSNKGHVWPSGWVVWKVANGPGFEPSAKGGVSSEGPKLVFCIHACVGATSAWGSSCVASISFHFHIDYNKVLKIHGARGLVCLPHAFLVSSSELCPPSEDQPPLLISIFGCENP